MRGASKQASVSVRKEMHTQDKVSTTVFTCGVKNTYMYVSGQWAAGHNKGHFPNILPLNGQCAKRDVSVRNMYIKVKQ